MIHPMKQESPSADIFLSTKSPFQCRPVINKAHFCLHGRPLQGKIPGGSPATGQDPNPFLNTLDQNNWCHITLCQLDDDQSVCAVSSGAPHALCVQFISLNLASPTRGAHPGLHPLNPTLRNSMCSPLASCPSQQPQALGSTPGFLHALQCSKLQRC